MCNSSISARLDHVLMGIWLKSSFICLQCRWPLGPSGVNKLEIPWSCFLLLSLRNSGAFSSTRPVGRPPLRCHSHFPPGTEREKLAAPRQIQPLEEEGPARSLSCYLLPTAFVPGRVGSASSCQNIYHVDRRLSPPLSTSTSKLPSRPSRSSERTPTLPPALSRNLDGM